MEMVLVVGSPNFSSAKGLVKVYSFNGASWSQIGSNIEGENDGDKLGENISINSDGKIIALGSPYYVSDLSVDSTKNIRICEYILLVFK